MPTRINPQKQWNAGEKEGSFLLRENKAEIKILKPAPESENL
jgi:hypothetical protein